METCLWKRKLSAYFHDVQANGFFPIAGIDWGDVDISMLTKAEMFANGATGVAFLDKCKDFQKKNVFIHPLCSQQIALDGALPANPQLKVAEALCAQMPSLGQSPQRFDFLMWRLCRNKAPEYSLYPADARLPDYTIWNHLAAKSALAACADENGVLKPALLMFQLGPVQDFIAQARSTRDLWSGSYMLSWLMAHALKAITDDIGPEAVIFPNLRGNGIYDALHKDAMYGRQLWNEILKERDGDESYSGPRPADRWLLTPTLPNRFLALVPVAKAESLAKAAAKAITDELENISKGVWHWLEAEARTAGCRESDIQAWKTRWDDQVKAFPQITWAYQEWLGKDETLDKLRSLPITAKGDLRKHLETLFAALAEDNNGLQNTEDNQGLLWSAYYALVDAKLAARRNTRNFTAWTVSMADKSSGSAPSNGEKSREKRISLLKDSLSGKEEIIGNEAFWHYLTRQYKNLFTAPKHCYGAMNLIKRLWCRAIIGRGDGTEEQATYLWRKLGLSEDTFERALSVNDVHTLSGKRNYYAVMAMDGDEMGKWISGEKTPKFREQIPAECCRLLDERHGKVWSVLKDMNRLLTPGYHLQFSETLANFATWIAESAVKRHGGQLIYAGGDDVLAMLPSDRAIACARTLQGLFGGKAKNEDQREMRINIVQPGYLHTNSPYQLLLPGMASKVSAGLVIGHEKSPMQMHIREAHSAEDRAKHEADRDALSITVYKRSGEIVHWSCKWSSVALDLIEKLKTWMPKSNKDDATSELSARFPYALAQQLAPYESPRIVEAKEYETWSEIIDKEIEIVLRQQGCNLSAENKEELRRMCIKWLESCRTKDSLNLDNFVQLFLTETFINRGLRGEK